MTCPNHGAIIIIIDANWVDREMYKSKNPDYLKYFNEIRIIYSIIYIYVYEVVYKNIRKKMYAVKMTKTSSITCLDSHNFL